MGGAWLQGLGVKCKITPRGISDSWQPLCLYLYYYHHHYYYFGN